MSDDDNENSIIELGPNAQRIAARIAARKAREYRQQIDPKLSGGHSGGVHFGYLPVTM